jgi:hypothetical protein
MAFGINKSMQKYLSNVFLTVVRYAQEWQLYGKIIKNNTLVKKISKSFPLTSDEELSEQIEDYIDDLYNEYSYVYVSYLLQSMGQGAIAGIHTSDFEKNSVDVKNISQISIEKTWSMYASYIDINVAKNIFKNVGVDFIFSPFSLIHFLSKEKLNSEKPILYFLNHEDFIAICIFQKEALLFASFFRTSTDEKLVAGDEIDDWEEEGEEKGVENLIELDHIDEEREDEEFSSLDDLENLDDVDSSVDTIDDENEASFSDIDEEKKDLGHFNSGAQEGNLELFGRDVLVYKYLSSSIREFYTNHLYESDFIKKVVIYDGYEISTDLVDMIENELMMEIEIDKIDINEKLCDMSIKEVFK